jgi:hypothetical protein
VKEKLRRLFLTDNSVLYTYTRACVRVCARVLLFVLLFILYTTPLNGAISSSDTYHHLYADDTQFTYRSLLPISLIKFLNLTPLNLLFRTG